MKKYKRFVAVFSGLYIICAVIAAVVIKNMNTDSDNEYRVEIKRISAALSKDISGETKQIISFDPGDYYDSKYVKAIEYMPMSVSNADTIQKFYNTKNAYQMEIVPIVQDNCATGYLRFDYVKQFDTNKYIIMTEVILFAVYLILMVALWYINHNILKPFNKIKDMPYELAKGNLNQEVKENKNKFFGKFIWGINMLRDSLESHNKKELRLTKDKKMMVLSISHDVKTPLNAINLYAKALEEGVYKTEESKREAVRKIQEKTEEINGFVQELIKSSQEEIVSIEVKDSEFYLKELKDKVTSGYSEKCSLNNIDFNIDDYENVLLKGDLDRAYEAIGNLIENAFKYGDGKRIAISFTEEEYCILVHVFNTGTPVGENEIAHLFEGFYRGSNAGDRPGNGLGLYICSEIMHKMGGDLYASCKDDGMEFVLVFRIC